MNELNKAGISGGEKKMLRANGIKIKEIHFHSVRDLMAMLNVSEIRALELRAMSEFQSVPSIGRRFAEDLMGLGFYSLKELKGKDPAKLLDRLERQIGAWIDPCVEDQFRLVVHYAGHPGNVKNWWDFTNERKAFRSKNGYPAGRPEKPWFELAQYKTANRLEASTATTKDDLHRRLKSAVKYMRDNVGEDITLAAISGVAHISPFHFLRLFKAAYDATPMQYLTRLRMKKACQLLKKTKRPVGAIATSCGFENQSSFSRLFKKEFGASPQGFRSQQSGRG